MHRTFRVMKSFYNQKTEDGKCNSADGSHPIGIVKQNKSHMIDQHTDDRDHFQGKIIDKTE